MKSTLLLGISDKQDAFVNEIAEYEKRLKSPPPRARHS